MDYGVHFVLGLFVHVNVNLDLNLNLNLNLLFLLLATKNQTAKRCLGVMHV